MDVFGCETAQEFLDVTAQYRANEPLRTNVLGSVAVGVAEGSRHYDAYYWWVVRDEGEVVGAAMRTVPFGLAVGPMDRVAAALLAAAAARDDDGFPSVNGPRSVVDAVVGAYATTGTTGSRRAVSSIKGDVLQAVSDLVVPDVEGAERLVELGELELAGAWTDAFALEAFGPGVVRAADPRYVELSETISSGRLSWWCVGGEPVSMAGHAPAVQTLGEVVTRIGPVYTPPPARRHGYGAAVTAAVSQRLLDGGSRVMLFADEENPTSNGVYRSLGYEVVDVFVRSIFERPD